MLLTALLGTLACSEDEPATTPDSSSTGSASSGIATGSDSSSATETGANETGTTAADSSDGGDTTAGSADCIDALTLDETFAMVGGDSTQVHPHVAFDSEHQGFWVAYTRPANDGTSNLATAIARVGCDGTEQMAAWTVSTSNANHTDPEVVVTDTRVLVIWAGDDGSGGDGNLDVLTRVLDRDGVPLSDEEQPLGLTRGGEPFTASAWMVRAAANPDGSFVVAGTRAIEEVSAFQVFVQRLDAEGVAQEPTIEPLLQPDVAHTEPRVAVGDDGVAHVAWSRTEDFSTYEVAAFSLPPGDDGRALVIETLGAEGDHAAVAAGSEVLWANSTQAGSGRDIQIWPALGGTALSLGAAGRIDHTPTLGLGDSEALAAWFRLVSGVRNEVVVARIDGAGTDTLTAGTPLVFPDVEAAPYPLALAPVGGSTYLVAWSEGDSPDFLIYGRFVDAASL